MRLDAADDWLPGVGLRFVSHAGLMEVALRERLIGVDAFGDDCPEATSRETLVVAGHRLGRPAILGRGDVRHRRDRQGVLSGMAFITFSAKSLLVAASIVLTSKTIKSGALHSKAQDHTLVEPDLAFAGGPQKMG